MERSHDDKESVGDPGDDGQLTIKIPNPKVYRARQSLWIGRRGKPRCDHCRLNNLKCDRVLPTCNHCSWASGRICQYTPLPTPAHRGIPRCDRCRVKNLKCDRNLPVCNFCAENDHGCNYTPKKRHKSAAEPVADTKMNEETTSGPGPSTPLQPPAPESASKPSGHTFYGQNIASQKHERSVSPSDQEGSSDPDIPLCIKTGRFMAEHSKASGTRHTGLQPIAPKPQNSQETAAPFTSQHFSPSQGVLIKSSTIEPWSDAAFVPLPGHIVQRLALINSVEVPDRQIFDDALREFIAGVMGELRETACLSPDVYSSIAHALKVGSIQKLPERLHAWVSFHHVFSGSEKRLLLIIPRDSIFSLDMAQAQRLRLDYCAYIDERLPKRSINPSVSTSLPESYIPEKEACFERVPVQQQIYDVLTYVHRSHGSPLDMMAEVRRLGFASITWPMAEIYVRLCPLCTLRAKEISQPRKDGNPKVGERELQR
ncbi:hypothetical protein JOM56_002338 [Amanita muscaria]